MEQFVGFWDVAYSDSFEPPMARLCQACVFQQLFLGRSFVCTPHIGTDREEDSLKCEVCGGGFHIIL
jgi:hypothetical protein